MLAWWCGQTQDVLHPAESPRRLVQTSEWQWRARVFIRWRYTESSCSLFTEDWCPLTLKALYSDNTWSLVPTLCYYRTVVLHKLPQVFYNWNEGKDVKCLSAYIIQGDTYKVYPAFNWVIRICKRELKNIWQLIIILHNWTVSILG